MRSFLTEQNYTQKMQTECLPFLQACRTEGHFAGFDGAPLFYVRYDAPKPRATVLLLHGLNESTEKYAELIFYMLQDGLSVLIYDHRGHGRSHRKTPLGLTHIDRFEDYVADARCCIQAQLASCPTPHYLYGHSMGGAIAAFLLESNAHPFAKAVLSSPMIQSFRYPGIPPALVRAFCRVISCFGGRRKRVFVAKEGDLHEDFANSCALSPSRFEAYVAIRRTEPLYQNGAVTYGWVAEAMGVTKRLLRRGAPEGITTPFRLYAAERDHLVELPAQQEFARRAPCGELVCVADSKHEIFAANDAVLHPYLNSVLDFFQEL